MGRDVAEPLRRGGLHCAFHARPFCTKPAEEFTGAAIVLLLDLETSGLDVTRDLVVEIAATVAPADPAAFGACFSTVVSGARLGRVSWLSRRASSTCRCWMTVAILMIARTMAHRDLRGRFPSHQRCSSSHTTAYVAGMCANISSF